MAESFPFAVRGRRRPGARFLVRTGHRTLVESLYLLTAPMTAAVGLLLVLGGLCAGAVGLLVPGGSGSCPARWHWRAGPPTWSGGGSPRYAPRPPGRGNAGHQLGPKKTPPRPTRGYGSTWRTRWRCSPSSWSPRGDGAVVVRRRCRPPRSRCAHPDAAGRCETLYVGSAQSHIDVSLGLTSPGEQLAFAITLGLLLLLTLPLVTRACVAVQAGLGQALLSDVSALLSPDQGAGAGAGYRPGADRRRGDGRGGRAAPARTRHPRRAAAAAGPAGDGARPRSASTSTAGRRLPGRRWPTRSSRLRRPWRSCGRCRAASPRRSSSTAGCARRSLPWPRAPPSR